MTFLELTSNRVRDSIPLLEHMQREAPESPANPPSYSRFIPSSAVRRDLRPAVILVASFSCVYGIIAGAAVLRRAHSYDGHLPTSLSNVYLVLAILYFFCAAIEAFGAIAAYKASIKLVRSYFYGAASVALIVTAAEILRLVVHYTQKSAILKACQDSYASDIKSGNATSSQVVSYCADNWRNATYLDIALLVFSLIVSFFFASLAASYLHQLKNPALLRTHAPHLAPSAAYAPPYGVPLQPYPSNSAVPPYPYSANPDPAGGPDGQAPSYDNPYGFKPSSDDKEYDHSHQAQSSNPFEDSVQHQHQTQTLLVRRPGETVEEFEERQHEHDQAEERRRRAENAFGESTETITLEGGGRRL
ncbi:uncharacterized protein JCM6883_003353 [Sporobolomyces salmoneus]|uniref:uncharacterized protein n=1 Tax=Sporobolomyces salmoneus TaxID=183962 RepID=UPI00317E1E07